MSQMQALENKHKFPSRRHECRQTEVPGNQYHKVEQYRSNEELDDKICRKSHTPRKDD